MARGPLDLWNEWATQILVLLSLTLQVALLLFAGIRRREACAVLRILLWQAYLLADSTAIYAIGHFSLSSGMSNQHQLVAFWAPFLLLHLGGPDNITAYALEDSQLWLRHLQNLVVQVLGAAYVLDKHLASGDPYILLAAMLMFFVGLVKYGERIWALKCGNLDRIRSSLKQPLGNHHHFHPLDKGPIVEAGEESFARRAHSLFHVCKHAIVDSWVEKDPKSVEMLRALKEEHYEGMWTLMEMELSLMYDLLYTKASVVHTWSGYCIRVVSPLIAAVSLLLFQFSAKDGHSSVDVAVTYTLLAGAFFLETISLFNALGSTWTYAFLCVTRWHWLRYVALCTGRWDRLRRLVRTVSGKGAKRRSERRWSGKMGQFNMLHLCSRYDRTYKSLLGRVARMLGYEEWWIRYHYSETVDISDDLKQRLLKYVKGLTRKGRSLNAQGVIRKNWGQEAMQKEGEDQLYKYLKSKNYLGVELQEGIIIWHIGTDVFLAESSGSHADSAAHLVKAIRTLSNYMMFLVLERPYMLPGLAQSTLYRQTRTNLVKMLERKIADTQKEDISTESKESEIAGPMSRDKLGRILYEEKPKYRDDAPRLSYAYGVADELITREKDKGSGAILQLLLYVWMDFLVYAANQCSREAHAKKLSNGSELTTILWLMTNYLHQEGYAVEPEDASITLGDKV